MRIISKYYKTEISKLGKIGCNFKEDFELIQ